MLDDIKLKLYVVMYLDPRFKAISFLDDSTKDEVRDSMKLELTTLIEQQKFSTDVDPLTPPIQSQNEMPPPKKTKLTSFFDGMIGPTNISVLLSPNEIALNELRKYDAEDPERLDTKEPLKWWKVREQQYKYMSQFVKQTLCTTMSSVPSERLISSAGNFVYQNRSCLSPENVDYLYLCKLKVMTIKFCFTYLFYVLLCYGIHDECI